MSTAAAAPAVAVRTPSRPSPGWWPVALWIAVPFAAAAVARDHYTGAILATSSLAGAYAVSWLLFAAAGGQPNWGHALPYGAGAYTVAVMAHAAHLGAAAPMGMTACALAGGATLAGAVIAGLQGRLTRQLTPVFVAVVTLATLEAARGLAVLATIPAGRVAPQQAAAIQVPAFPGGEAAIPWVAAAVFGAMVVILAALARSRFGAALRAAGRGDRRAAVLGFDGPRLRLAAAVLAGAMAGLAGGLSAQLAGRVTTASLSWHLTLFAPAAVLLGGAGTVVGPAAAAYVLAGLGLVFDVPPGLQLLAFAAVIAAAALRDPRHLFARGFEWTRPGAEPSRRPDTGGGS
jgi:ABC-type branched-subunit amino acid transport system permease subunit